MRSPVVIPLFTLDWRCAECEMQLHKMCVLRWMAPLDTAILLLLDCSAVVSCVGHKQLDKHSMKHAVSEHVLWRGIAKCNLNVRAAVDSTMFMATSVQHPMALRFISGLQ